MNTAQQTPFNQLRMNEQQLKVLQHTLEGKKNLVVEAYAGSGKTTTIQLTLREYINQWEQPAPNVQPAIYMAFMNSAVNGAKENLHPRAYPSTINALGHQLLMSEVTSGKKVNVDRFKYQNMAGKFMRTWGINSISNESAGYKKDTFSDLLKLVRAWQSPYNDPVEMQKIGTLYGLKLEQWMIEGVSEAMELGIAQTLEGIWDFDDQIYMPYALGYTPKTKYSIVAIDELQDLTVGKLWLAQQYAYNPDAGMLGVGDRFQAIMAFAGAMHDSMDVAIKSLDADIIALPKTYRFGENISKEVKYHVPLIESAPEVVNAGIVETVDYVPAVFNDDTVIIGRNNAPLIEIALELVASGVPVQLRAKNLNKTMAKYMSAIRRMYSPSDNSELRGAIEQYKAKERTRLQEAGADSRVIGTMVEACNCLSSSIKVADSQGIDLKNVMRKIDDLFDSQHGVVLSTAHAFKGSEANEVYLLERGAFSCNKRGDESIQEWEKRQEANLLYVAQTRAKLKLIYVDVSAVDPVIAIEKRKQEMKDEQAKKQSDLEAQARANGLIVDENGEITPAPDPTDFDANLYLEVIDQLRVEKFNQRQIEKMLKGKDTNVKLNTLIDLVSGLQSRGFKNRQIANMV